MLSQSSFGDQSPISTGQERVESAIEGVLRTGGTRSELRALVDRYADLARVIGISPAEAIARLDAVAGRAAAATSPSSSAAMMARWCSARYQRAD